MAVDGLEPSLSRYLNETVYKTSAFTELCYTANGRARIRTQISWSEANCAILLHHTP